MTPAQKKAITKAFGPAAVEFLNGLADAVAALHTRQELIERQLLTMHASDTAQAKALDTLATKQDLTILNDALRRDIAQKVNKVYVDNAMVLVNEALDCKADRRRPFLEWLFGPRVPV